jgi:PHP domain-containing protein
MTGAMTADRARPAEPARTPRRIPRRRAIAIAAFVIVILFLLQRGLLIAAMAPWSQPAPGLLRSAALRQTAYGAVHVHTSYSHDGGGSIEDVRKAAAKAGYGFAVVTDHNDLRAAPSATSLWPALVVGEEVSTTGGHVLAIGVKEEVRALGPQTGMSVTEAIDAIEKQGALPIIAHPTRHRAGWDRSARERVRAIEIYNADNDWRDENPLEILGCLITYPIAPVRTLALLIDYPEQNLALWDSLLVTRDVAGVGGCDAHARFDLPFGARLAFPGYWSAFSVVSTQVWPWWPGALNDSTLLSQIDPSQYLLHCLEARQANVIFPALGRGDGFVFQFRSGDAITMTGGHAALEPGRDARFIVIAPGGNHAILRILKDGGVWREGAGPVLEERVTEPGVYRCEVSQPRRLPPLYRRKEFPWIFSNAIRIVQEGA